MRGAVQDARSGPIRRRFSVALLLLLGLVVTVAAPGSADDVFLENGRVFEDVVATVTDRHVVIEMEYGRLRLPRAQVQRVEERTTPLETFRGRRSALLTDPSSSASSWAELALWAWAHELRRDATETALLAVRLDPRVEGLDALLTQQGYARDPELGWVPYAEAMERRGLVAYRGEWMTPERRAALSAEERAAREAAEEARERARDERGDDRDGERGPTSNEVALASIELAREVAAGNAIGSATGNAAVTLATTSGLSPFQPVFIPALPLSGSSGFWTGRGQHHHPPRRPTVGPIGGHRSRISADWEALASRIPGSRLPLSSFRPPR